MPLHFGSITNNVEQSAFLAYLAGPILRRVDCTFDTPDKRYSVLKSNMIDVKSGDVIGEYVFTLRSNRARKCREILDIDITLKNPVQTELYFLERLEGSSDANEYWDVETADEYQRLRIETVCRHTIPEDMTDSVRGVAISAFPFSLRMYDDIDTFNRRMGFTQPPEGDTGFTIRGFSETFLSPGGLLSDSNPGEVHSDVLGTVESFRDVRVDMGNRALDFVLAQIRTGLGTIPVAMGREVFDLEGIAPGKLIYMSADIKADLTRPDVFHKI